MGTIAMTIGGLLALVLGVIGIWNFFRRGHVLSRSGEIMADSWVWWYVIPILGGAALIGWAIRFFRRHWGLGDRYR